MLHDDILAYHAFRVEGLVCYVNIARLSNYINQLGLHPNSEII